MYFKIIAIALILMGICYLSGKSECRQQQNIEQLKEIKNVSYQSQKIFAAPSADKLKLLELMRSGKF